MENNHEQLNSEDSEYIEVNFEHLRIDLDEDSLQYNSPHYKDKRARDGLLEFCQKNAKMRGTPLKMRFCRDQINLANEVFPEAAVADPLADLEILDEWKNGIRVFPYPGHYSRFELFIQEAKSPPTTSVGVIGEIMAGLFAQVGISPWIIVRVIGNWPDFIFYDPKEQRYSFVEAKAFTSSPGSSSPFTSSPESSNRIQSSLLRECALDAVRQINTDPWVTVWGAFTYIAEIKPFKLEVTFVEFDCPTKRDNSGDRKGVPDVVVRGIATRCVVQGIQDIQNQDPERLLPGNPPKDESLQDDLEKASIESVGELSKKVVPQTAIKKDKNLSSDLEKAASECVEELLEKVVPQTAIKHIEKKVNKEIKDIISKILKLKEADDQRPFYEGRRKAAAGETARIREICKQTIYMKELSSDEIDSFDRDWKPDWERASQTHTENANDEIKKWRFGGALYWLE